MSTWVKLGLLTNDRQVFPYGKDEVLVIRLGVEFKAYSNICPHKLGPLSGGELVLENGRVGIECPWHGFIFDANSGECINKKCPSLFRYAVSVDKDNNVYVLEDDNGL